MNERIKELELKAYNWAAQQAVGLNACSLGSNYFLTLEKEKFAELIVKECANHCDLLLDHKISSEWSRGTHDCSREIKKHFGIE